MMKILFLIIFNACFLLGFAQDGLGVVANGASTNQMNIKEAKAYLKGKYNFWKNNSKVTIVLPSNKNPNSTKVAQEYYNTNPDGVKRYWLSLVFQGRSSSPVFLDTDTEIIDFIQKNPGSIGIVSEELWKSTDEKYKITILK